MKQLWMLVWATLTLPALALAAEPPAIGDKVLNGGSLMTKNGRYVTFYDAGMYVAPMSSAQVPLQLPALLKLQDYIMQVPLLSDSSRARLLNAIVQTSSRNYYIADPVQLTPEVRARLLEEFKRVTKVDPANLRLAALTDSRAKNTFLLPEFFDDSVTEIAQMTILFHEAYWLMKPNATYNQVVNAEMAFQAALENPGNASLLYDFLRHVGTQDEAFAAMLKWEIQAGYLKGFLQNGNQFTIGQLISPEHEACLARLGRPQILALFDYRRVCSPYFQMHLNRLLATYPQSMLLRSLAERFENGYTDEKQNFGYSFLRYGVDWNGRDGSIQSFRDASVLRHLSWERFKKCVVTIDGGEMAYLGGARYEDERKPYLTNLKCEGGVFERTFRSNFELQLRRGED